MNGVVSRRRNLRKVLQLVVINDTACAGRIIDDVDDGRGRGLWCRGRVGHWGRRDDGCSRGLDTRCAGWLDDIGWDGGWRVDRCRGGFGWCGRGIELLLHCRDRSLIVRLWVVASSLRVTRLCATQEEKCTYCRQQCDAQGCETKVSDRVISRHSSTSYVLFDLLPIEQNGRRQTSSFLPKS